MDKEKIIQKIVSPKGADDQHELLSWANNSTENKREYIRYKNLWAILQRGEEMPKQHVESDFKAVKARINSSSKRMLFMPALRYAAVFVVALFTGLLAHHLFLNIDISMNVVEVPKGNRTSISLPDGTQVWLSNGSKLTYPETFRGKSRDVELMGEAYFTVTHNADKPFFVKLGSHRVKVLGTEFSVLAYPNDSIIQVDLASGKVQLEVNTSTHGKSYYRSVALNPLQSLALNKLTGKLRRSRIPNNFYTYWQEGNYTFLDESFESLAQKIDRIYGVQLIFEDERIKQRTFSGAFNVDDNIYTIMEVFKSASQKPFSYRVEGKTIRIKSIN
ncbi:DUF4974 domain-containing protein [Prolixibacteraceae bacterium JC049]|nr:DUF4974 domain-containing protein [Prolixibacteraceae bacterium JC049]